MQCIQWAINSHKADSEPTIISQPWPSKAVQTARLGWRENVQWVSQDEGSWATGESQCCEKSHRHWVVWHRSMHWRCNLLAKNCEPELIKPLDGTTRFYLFKPLFLTWPNSNQGFCWPMSVNSCSQDWEVCKCLSVQKRKSRTHFLCETCITIHPHVNENVTTYYKRKWKWQTIVVTTHLRGPTQSSALFLVVRYCEFCSLRFSLKPFSYFASHFVLCLTYTMGSVSSGLPWSPFVSAAQASALRSLSEVWLPPDPPPGWPQALSTFCVHHTRKSIFPCTESSSRVPLSAKGASLTNCTRLYPSPPSPT